MGRATNTKRVKSRVGFPGIRADAARRGGQTSTPRVTKAGPLGDESFFQILRLQLQGDPLTMPYAQNPWVYAAINAIARNIAGVPFEIITGDRKNPAVVETGPWADLFGSPNPIMSRWQLYEATVIYLMLGGETLWVLEGSGPVRKEDEIPTEIWVHPKDNFKPITNRAGNVIEAWEFKAPKSPQKIRLELSQVIQFKLWNPYDPLRGLAPLDAARAAVRQAHKASQFNEAFFDNGGQVGGIFTSEKGMTSPQVSQLQTQYDERHVGQRKRGKVMVLHGGLKFEAADVKHKDMDFVEMMKLTMQDVLAVYKVPKAELSVYEDLNFATAVSQDKGFWQKTLIPLMRYLEDVLWHRLFAKADGGAAWGHFDLGVVEALQSDFGEKVKTAEILARIGFPINAINDRLQLGMERVKWGDDFLANATLLPASALVNGGVGPPAEKIAAEKPPAKALIMKARPERLALWTGYIAKVFTPVERRFMVKLKVYFGSQRRDVLNRFSRVAKDAPGYERRDLRPDQVDEILFADKEWDEKLKTLVDPLYKQAAKASIAAVEAELGGFDVPFDALDPDVLRFLEAKKIEVVAVNQTVKEALRQSLFDGIRAKETVSELQDRIKNVYQLADSDSRRLRIARTETGQVLAGTRQLAYEAEGVERIEWVTAGDENVRESHRAQDGMERKVGDKFPNGLEYPLDPNGPASEVVNCRCVQTVVAK